MGIRTGANAPLGVPAFGRAFDDAQGFPLGTIIPGFDDTTGIQNEYIWLRSPAGIVAGDDVTYDANYLATEVAAGAGQADAIVASGVNQYAWFQVKSRRAATG